MKTNNKVVMFILVLALTLVACNFMMGDNAETDIVGANELADGTDYHTEFEDSEDWLFFSLYDLDDYSLEVDTNGLSISLIHPNDIISGYLEFWYTDVTISTHTDYAGGDADATYEVICRASDVGEYIFAFDLLGYYYVWYYDAVNEEITELDSGESGSINTVSGSNELTVSCIGENLDFYINNDLVSSITDDTLPDGQVGLGVETYSDGTVKAYFTFFNVVTE